MMRGGLLLALAALLAGCGGGGGGGGSPSTRAPLPTLSEDGFPSGDRIDVSTRAFFVVAAGDETTYSSSNNVGQALVVRRRVTAGPDAEGRFTSVEDVPADTSIAPLSSAWRLSTEGLVAVNYRSSDRLQGPALPLGDFLLYPTPFYPVGSVRTAVRQGGLGADVDGDGVADSFRFDFTQVFEGFENGERGGRLELRARFRHRTLITIQPSRLDRSAYTLSDLTEQVELGAHAGLTSLTRSELWASGLVGRPYDDLALLGGTAGGRDLSTAWNAGSARLLRLDAASLVYEPVLGSYYAGLRATAPDHAGSVARIVPATGETTFSEALGGSVRSVDVSADGTMLYAAIEGRNEVVGLSLPSLQVSSRIALPAGVSAYTLAVSPVDAATFAWYGGSSTATSGPHLVRAGVIQPRSGNGNVTPNSPLGTMAFSADGTQLFMIGTAAAGFGLHRLAVLADGISPSVTTAPELPGGQSLVVQGERVVAGSRAYRAADLAPLLAASPSVAVSCRPLRQSTRWACDPGGLAPLGVTVIDEANGLSLIEDGNVPLPAPLPTDLGQAMLRLPGPPGQVAMLFANSGSTQGSWLALFDNPDFR